MPARSSARSSRPSSRSAWQQVVVGCAGGDDAEPGVARARVIAVEPFSARVLPRELEPYAGQRALQLERLRREQVAEGRCTYGPPSHSSSGITGVDAVGRRPRRCPRASATLVTTFSALHRPEAREHAIACRPRSSTSCTLPGEEAPACAARRAVDSEALGSVEDLHAGSSPHERERAAGADRCRRSCRGGARRPRGRRPGALPYQTPSTPS